ncbi:MAG: phage major tail tube protein, partial [Pseudomonadota bacterium]
SEAAFSASLIDLYRKTANTRRADLAEAMLKISWEVDYFRVEINGEDVVEIDVENGRRIIDGVDQLAEIRAAMGL